MINDYISEEQVSTIEDIQVNQLIISLNSIDVDSNLQIGVELTNNGDNADVNFTIDFYLIVMNTSSYPPTMQQIYHFDQQVMTEIMDPGFLELWAFDLFIPSSIPSGLYYLQAIVDEQNALMETVETNNNATSTEAITIIGKVDLLSTSLDIPQVVSPNSSIIVNTTVSNYYGDSPDNFTVLLFLSSDNKIDTENILVGNVTVTELISTVTIEFNFSVYSLTGEFYVILQIDPQNRIDEVYEDNNIYVSQTTLILEEEVFYDPDGTPENSNQVIPDIRISDGLNATDLSDYYRISLQNDQILIINLSQTSSNQSSILGIEIYDPTGSIFLTEFVPIEQSLNITEDIAENGNYTIHIYNKNMVEEMRYDLLISIVDKMPPEIKISNSLPSKIIGGNTIELIWNTSGTDEIDFVNIILFGNNEMSQIIEMDLNSAHNQLNSYIWMIPLNLSTGVVYEIRIEWTLNTSIYDTSVQFTFDLVDTTSSLQNTTTTQSPDKTTTSAVIPELTKSNIGSITVFMMFLASIIISQINSRQIRKRI